MKAIERRIRKLEEAGPAKQCKCLVNNALWLGELLPQRLNNPETIRHLGRAR